MYSGGLDDGNARTHLAGVAHERPGFHTERLGLVRSRDAATALRQHRCHAHRPTAEFGVEVLLHPCEVGIAIDEEDCQWPGHGVGQEWKKKSS
jgi:hypothetical protein